jgi:hypothetical protein
MQLAGVGGLGGAEGLADQDIILRIGGDGRADDVTSTPFQGSFIIKVRPVVMTEELARTIGHSALIGMSVLWRANACIDPTQRRWTSPHALLATRMRGFQNFHPVFHEQAVRVKASTGGRLGFLTASQDARVLPPTSASGSATTEAAAPPTEASCRTVDIPRRHRRKPPSKMMVATATSLPEQVSKVLTRALTNLLPGDKTWAAQKYTTWDPDTGTVEITPLTPKAKPQTAGMGTSAQEARTQVGSPAAPWLPSDRPVPHQARVPEQPLRKPQLGTPPTGQLRRTSGTPRSIEFAPNIQGCSAAARHHTRESPATAYPGGAKRQALQADHEHRLKQLEADVKLLRQALTPARSAPLESVTQPVRDIKPPLNQTLAPVPKLGDNPSGGASGSASQEPKVIPNPAPPTDKRGKGPKALQAERPSTHGMLTRRQAQQSTNHNLHLPLHPQWPPSPPKWTFHAQ